jgi:hypothetical protein
MPASRPHAGDTFETPQLRDAGCVERTLRQRVRGRATRSSSRAAEVAGHLTAADGAQLSRILRSTFGIEATAELEVEVTVTPLARRSPGGEPGTRVRVGDDALTGRTLRLRLPPAFGDLAPAADRNGRSYPAFLAVRNERGKIAVIPTAEIELVEAASKWIEVHTAEATWLARGPLQELAGLLDPQRFLRISRSAIVGLGKIREIHPSLGRFVVVLASDKRLTSGPTYHTALRDFVANRPRPL